MQAGEKLANNTDVRLVMGNESADLDSIICALLLSYGYALQDKCAVIPVINCAREDYRLRTESYGLLKRYDIDAGDLIFFEDLPADWLDSPGKLSITLVDHNLLPDKLLGWSDNVAAILDHHHDTGLYLYADPRILAAVGSCSTLVAEYLMNQTAVVISEELATLLLAAILVDTINLDPSQGRVTAMDISVASRLRKISKENPQKLYQDLQAMKGDVSGLSSAELLRKDYKQWTTANLTYGIASVPVPLQQWLQQDSQAVHAIRAFMQTRQLFFLIVMTAYVADTFTREMLICCERHDDVLLLENLFNHAGLQLTELNEIPEVECFCKAYHQSGVNFSRKKIQPVIADLIKQL